MEITGSANAQPFVFPENFPAGDTLKDHAGSEVGSWLHEYWWNFKPLEPQYYFGLGMLYIFGGLLAVTGNFLVLFIFSKYPKLRKPANILVMNLAVCDLMMVLTLVPETTVGLLSGGTWPFGWNLCILHAFCGALFGYGQITTLVFIAHDRYNVIVNGFAGRALTMSKVKQILAMIWCYSLFWSVGPVMGFGGYSVDGLISACSFDYMNREPMNTKYIVACALFCYFIPLIFIMTYYYRIVKAVWVHEAILKEQAKKMNVSSLRSTETSSRISGEVKIAKVAITNVGLWIIAWTPFAIVSLIGVIGNQELLTPVHSAVAILLAKSSCLYNPIVYAISHPRYRECLKQTFPCLFCTKEQRFDSQSTASEMTKI